MRKESILYKKLNSLVQCQTCAHYCLLKENQLGRCGVRINLKGKLYFLLYEKAIAAEIDPIEKKPFYHFLPGSFSFSFATVGCNFRCLNCQNWALSQAPRLKNFSYKEIEAMGFDLKAEEIIKKAKENQCLSIAYTYTEPTIFLEYGLEVMKLAKKEGLKNVWVSNGFQSQEVIALISPYLDAINIDFKFFDEKNYQEVASGHLKPVLNSILEFKKRKIWLELTTLIIPNYFNEKTIKEMANFIKKEVGKETPWHLSGFSASISWQMKGVNDTLPQTLEKFCEIAKKEGLDYVYAGNLLGSKFEHTFCPRCKKIVIERRGYFIKRKDKKGHCPFCGYLLPLILK